MQLRNIFNFVLSSLIIGLLVLLIPTVYSVFVAFSTVLLGIRLAEWFMTITRKYIFWKAISPKNKAVLITGCDTGFGNDLANRMDHLGYKVYACCLDPNGEGAKMLLNESSEKLVVLSMDVTDKQNIKEVKEFVARDLGRNMLWAVINNAGITHLSQIDWTSVDEIQKVYDVNTNGTLCVTKAFLPLLKKAKGRIINVASISGRFHVPAFVGYCMSKSAVIALTTGLRVELAKWGIKAISIEPSFYSTPLVTIKAVTASAVKIWKTAPEEIKEEYGEVYIQSFKTYIKNCLEFGCNPNRSEVIDCMEDAITAEEPLSTYFPCSLTHRLFITLLQNLPNVVHELIQIKLLERGAKPIALTLKKNYAT